MSSLRLHNAKMISNSELIVQSSLYTMFSYINMQTYCLKSFPKRENHITARLQWCKVNSIWKFRRGGDYNAWSFGSAQSRSAYSGFSCTFQFSCTVIGHDWFLVSYCVKACVHTCIVLLPSRVDKLSCIKQPSRDRKRLFVCLWGNNSWMPTHVMMSVTLLLYAAHVSSTWCLRHA